MHYSKLRLITQATELFNSISSPDVASWNALLWGYVHNGKYTLALHLLLHVPEPTYIALLKACTHLCLREKKAASLEKGMAVHAHLLERKLETNFLVASSLVVMYSTCGSMIHVATIFEKLRTRDVVVWTSLMLGYVENGESERVLELFMKMQVEGCEANSRTFMALVKAFTSLAAEEEDEFLDGKAVHVKPVSLERAMSVHSQVSRLNQLDMFLEGSLLGLYTSSGA